MKNSLLLIALFGFGCGPPSPDFRWVTHAEYVEIGACWLDELGYFEGFLVFSDIEEGRAVPNFVSYKCAEKDDQTDNSSVTINNLPGVYVEGVGQAFLKASKGEISFDVISNVPTDQPSPRSQSAVYKFRGKLSSMDNSYMKNLYKIEKIICVQKFTLNFGLFLKMPPSERLNMFVREAKCKQ